MSAVRTLLAVAARLVATAEAEGIEVGTVTMHPVLGVRLHPVDPGLTPALALALGLTDRHVMEQEDESVEFFRGEVVGVRIDTHHVLGR